MSLSCKVCKQNKTSNVCVLHLTGNVPADVDLQTGVRRGWEAVCGQEVPLIWYWSFLLHHNLCPKPFTHLSPLRNTYGRLLVLYEVFLILTLSKCHVWDLLQKIVIKNYNIYCVTEETGLKLLCFCPNSQSDALSIGGWCFEETLHLQKVAVSFYSHVL